MAGPYIPNTDAGFDSWLTNFSALLTDDPALYGLEAGDAVAVAAQQTAYHAAFLAATTPETRTSPTIAAKDAAKVTALAVVRPYAVSISLNSGVTNENKSAIGVTVRVTTPTPVPAPTTVPVLGLVAGSHLVHQLSYKDASTPTTKAKPFGAVAMQLFRFIGTTVPSGPDEARFHSNVTKSPLLSTFDAEDVGKICTYYARWQTRGSGAGEALVGPWSSPVSFAIM